MSEEIAIRVKNVSKDYLIYKRPPDRLKQMIIPRVQRLAQRKPTQYFQNFSALKNISFEVKRGETVGIVGRNGCGKSTILKIICSTLQASSGSLTVNGRIAALLELGAGFNPEFTGRENIYMNGAILGINRKEMDNRFDAIAEFAAIGEFIERPVKLYSSGMYVRLAFAVAINVDPDIMVIDEALAVGDVAFQRKCFARLDQIKQRGGTILFVSHSTGSVVELCDRAILLDGGELLLDGKPKQVTNQYLKLVHMPTEKLAEAREMIKALQDLPDEEITEQTDIKAPAVVNASAEQVEESEEAKERRLEEEEGWYDPNLKSQSVVEYESKGARIRDLRILAPSGRQVNVLKMGQRYTYEYYVDFEDVAKKVVVGMLIKTTSGLGVGGAATKPETLRIPHLDPGTSIHVVINYTCGLLPGTYFINAGVMGVINGEESYLHRILDGSIFRVAESKDIVATGLVDMNVQPTVSVVTPNKQKDSIVNTA